MTTKKEDDIRTLIAAAYEAGALAVHQNWQEDREPDFSEAASDHVASVAETIRTALSVPLGMGEDMPERTSSAAARQHAPEGVAFQTRVSDWMMQCFGANITNSKLERCYRFSEEAGELVQALGMTEQQWHDIGTYVWGRPVGEPSQEVGGVMVTLAALCFAADLNMAEDGETELTRINSPAVMDKIRAKHAAKVLRTPFSALPGQPSEGTEPAYQKPGPEYSPTTPQAPDSSVALEWNGNAALMLNGRAIGHIYKAGTEFGIAGWQITDTFPTETEARQALETAAREWLSIPSPSAARKDG